MHWSASRWTPVKAVRIPEEETDETYKYEERMRIKEVRKQVFGREARTWGRKQAEIEKSGKRRNNECCECRKHGRVAHGCGLRISKLVKLISAGNVRELRKSGNG